MKKFDIMKNIRREMRLKNLSDGRVAKKIGVSEIEMTEFFLERNVNLELLEKVIEVVFESYEFQYSFKENPLKKFSTKELLQELMRREK
ncbi:hypothetical protein [Candidatus Cetobacterium colombiensis]|uniref:HTH cro/C1-type domain-containing protein n=1 Tax=Candidatus Cetobacterium colombiensis TaxID=3073100 RepID=A0ABU4WDW9_9FUSO|nr:hypothetical protein [Candidatus Cetobacterium colombiensis]MDX8337355.1 hypothetical protein [Candidatus Cetobacterium colombiensis]